MDKRLLTALMILTLFIAGCSKKDDPKSNSKDLISFTFNAFTPAMTGVIDQTNKTVKITNIPGDADITTLVPTIVVSPDATVSPSTGSPNNFTSPVVYTVTAEDGTSVNYTITVTQAAQTLSGSMTANRTLTDRIPGDAIDYIIDGAFYVEGNALLTIDPGVKIAFTGTNGWITVTENAGLKMVGTLAKPIILTGPVNNTNKGSWGGVEFQSNRADNLMEFVQISYAGSSEQYGAVHISPDAKLSIKNCLIEKSASHGLWVDGTISAFANNTIKDCEKAPVFAADIREAAKIDAASVFANNMLPYVIVNYGFHGSDQSADLTLKKIAIPYLFKSGVWVVKKLTVEPGATLLFDDASFIEVQNIGTLNASGTSELPITFKHVNGTAGGWQGIFIETATDNKLAYCVIENGGSYINSNCNVYLGSSAKLSVSNTVIRKTTGYGFMYYDNSVITASNVTFTECSLGNVYNVDTDAVSASL
ncbi:MAG TPA: DUF5018 domain-containing protein [Bacteroidales bacterium]|nr:DUF5018 domain-containing protein [Bacteroidales bacterium]